MSERAKVLVIDDEGDFCDFVKMTLEKTGRFNVAASTDGANGITMAESDQPDLILLDIKMPEMSGAEVAERLLQNDVTRDIPIAFITGLLPKEEVSKRSGYIHGFLFITKPVTRNELVQQIDSVFQIVKRQKAFVESLEA
jgi:CheY-like chemotaxis protein